MLEKRERGRTRDCPNILDTPTILEKGEATDFKCGRYIHGVHSNKNPLKISGKVAAAAQLGTPENF